MSCHPSPTSPDHGQHNKACPPVPCTNRKCASIPSAQARCVVLITLPSVLSRTSSRYAEQGFGLAYELEFVKVIRTMYFTQITTLLARSSSDWYLEHELSSTKSLFWGRVDYYSTAEREGCWTTPLRLDCRFRKTRNVKRMLWSVPNEYVQSIGYCQGTLCAKGISTANAANLPYTQEDKRKEANRQ